MTLMGLGNRDQGQTPENEVPQEGGNGSKGRADAQVERCAARRKRSWARLLFPSLFFLYFVCNLFRYILYCVCNSLIFDIYLDLKMGVK